MRQTSLGLFLVVLVFSARAGAEPEFSPTCVPEPASARMIARGAPAEAFEPPRGRVVALSEAAASLLTLAAERSPLIISQLWELERSGMVIYVTNLKAGQAPGPKSYLSFLAAEASLRYVLIRIEHWQISPNERLALLGHELEHALEVARASEVRDALGMAALFRRIGHEVSPNSFETAAARETGHRVRAELLKQEW